MQAPMQFQTTLSFDRALLIPQVVSNKKADMLIALLACSSPLRTETILTYHLSSSKPWCSIDCIKHHVSNENLWSRSMAFRSDITNCLLQDSFYSVRGTCGSLALKKRNCVLWEAKVGEGGADLFAQSFNCGHLHLPTMRLKTLLQPQKGSGRGLLSQCIPRDSFRVELLMSTGWSTAVSSCRQVRVFDESCSSKDLQPEEVA